MVMQSSVFEVHWIIVAESAGDKLDPSPAPMMCESECRTMWDVVNACGPRRRVMGLAPQSTLPSSSAPGDKSPDISIVQPLAQLGSASAALSVVYFTPSTNTRPLTLYAETAFCLFRSRLTACAGLPLDCPVYEPPSLTLEGDCAASPTGTDMHRTAMRSLHFIMSSHLFLRCDFSHPSYACPIITTR